MSDEVLTCSGSLLNPRTCCARNCFHSPTLAALDSRMVEHARCSIHVAEMVETKPLVWREPWGPDAEVRR